MSAGDEELLERYARSDWLYAKPRFKVLHNPVSATYDGSEWCAKGVTFACGWTTARAWIPGLFSRLGAQRCSRCCDKLGLPRGKGSPKNDPACRAALGLDDA